MTTMSTNWREQAPIKSERLLLRKMELSDAQDMFEFLSIPSVGLYTYVLSISLSPSPSPVPLFLLLLGSPPHYCPSPAYLHLISIPRLLPSHTNTLPEPTHQPSTSQTQPPSSKPVAKGPKPTTLLSHWPLPLPLPLPTAAQVARSLASWEVNASLRSDTSSTLFTMGKGMRLRRWLRSRTSCGRGCRPL